MYDSLETSSHWVIDGLIADGEFAVLTGPPSSGKSTLALNLALTLAAGTGIPRNPARNVLYVAAPGDTCGLSGRMKAWNIAHGQPPPSLFRVIETTLGSRREVDALAVTLREFSEPVVVIDVGTVNHHITRLRTLSATVLLVHPERVAPAIRNAADCELYLVKHRSSADWIELTHEKFRHGRVQDALFFALKPVTIDPMQDVTAVVINPLVPPPVPLKRWSRFPRKAPSWLNQARAR